jgi:hypothetical protein
MAYTTIVNGDTPDATVVMGNFVYLLALITGGQAIKSDTLANLKTAAAAAPTVAFLAIPTDLKALLLYTGVAAAGPDADGFVTITSWETIS